MYLWGGMDWLVANFIIYAEQIFWFTLGGTTFLIIRKVAIYAYNSNQVRRGGAFIRHQLVRSVNRGASIFKHRRQGDQRSVVVTPERVKIIVQ